MFSTWRRSQREKIEKPGGRHPLGRKARNSLIKRVMTNSFLRDSYPALEPVFLVSLGLDILFGSSRTTDLFFLIFISRS